MSEQKQEPSAPSVRIPSKEPKEDVRLLQLKMPLAELRQIMEVTGAETITSAAYVAMRWGLRSLEKARENVDAIARLGQLMNGTPPTKKVSTAVLTLPAEPITRAQLTTLKSVFGIRGVKNVTEEMLDEFWEWIVLNNFRNAKEELITKNNVGKTLSAWKEIRDRQARETERRNEEREAERRKREEDDDRMSDYMTRDVEED